MLYHCTKCQFTTLAADFLCCGPIEQGPGTIVDEIQDPNTLDWADDDQLNSYWYGIDAEGQYEDPDFDEDWDSNLFMDEHNDNLIREFRNSGI